MDDPPTNNHRKYTWKRTDHSMTSFTIIRASWSFSKSSRVMIEIAMLSNLPTSKANGWVMLEISWLSTIFLRSKRRNLCFSYTPIPCILSSNIGIPGRESSIILLKRWNSSCWPYWTKRKCWLWRSTTIYANIGKILYIWPIIPKARKCLTTIL